MKKIMLAILALSLLANGWLLLRRDSTAGTDNAPPATQGTVLETTRAAAQGGVAAGGSPVEATTNAAPRANSLLETLVSLDVNDPAGARDRLRAAGADPATTFAVVDGMFRIRFYNAMWRAEIENRRAGWWRGNPARGANYPSWNKMAQAPLIELFGPDPLDVADYMSRYDFLPEKKARLLAMAAVDYVELQTRVSSGGMAPDPRASALLMNERKNEVLGLLTPEEKVEYDLRFSEFAALQARRFAKMQATETEFRTLSPLLERAQQELNAVSRDPNIPPAQRATAQRAAEQRVLDDLVATVGYERAADYIWSGTAVAVREPATSSVVALPAAASSPKLLQLATETGRAAATIHSDRSLSLEAKQAALVSLQEATQPKLDQLLPASEREGLEPQALSWFNGLGKGEYVSLMPPRLTGSASVVLTPVSISTPARGALPESAQLRAIK